MFDKANMLNKATMLEALIKQEIREKGAMSVAHYMSLCLTHPQFGYYRIEDPLGKDFTTSPEISQIFGELIGVWVLMKWQARGAVTPLQLIELGPGRGTLMKDILRVLTKFKVETKVTLVEINATLQEKQRENLHGHQVTWVEDIQEITVKDAILVANEFLDCLPIQQFVGTEERNITLEGETFVLKPQGDVREICPALPALLASLPANDMLFIDYGGFGGRGDTLQAMQNGKLVDALTACGQADLTAHVDFTALQQAGEALGFTATCQTQRDFLLSLGFEARFNTLKEPTAIRLIENASPRAMGVLFKVMELAK